MTSRERPLRADAARNRARVLEVAYDVFAAEGLSVPIDEIAERAGVGAGTVYRHFPTKDALIRAVIDDRVRGVVEHGRALLAADPPQALFEFLRWMTAWGRTDLGLVEALAGAGIDLAEVAPDADTAFRAIVADMVNAGNRAGTVRADVTAADVKALMGACQVADAEAMERIMTVVIDGLRAAR